MRRRRFWMIGRWFLGLADGMGRAGGAGWMDEMMLTVIMCDRYTFFSKRYNIVGKVAK